MATAEGPVPSREALREGLHQNLVAGVIAQFHSLYYYSANLGGTWNDTYWLGVRVHKCPLDLWIYQEIVWEIRPDLVIETGTMWGGSALYLACLCDLVGKGQVLTIDVEPKPNRPAHPRIEYLTGSSVAPETLAVARERVGRASSVLVILDSDHTADHVYREMIAFAPLVSAGSYLIVEDSNLNGHPVFPTFGPGPFEAIGRFLKDHPEFQVDSKREKLLLTFNPRGYLRKRKSDTAT